MRSRERSLAAELQPGRSRTSAEARDPSATMHTIGETHNPAAFRTHNVVPKRISCQQAEDTHRRYASWSRRHAEVAISCASDTRRAPVNRALTQYRTRHLPASTVLLHATMRRAVYQRATSGPLPTVVTTYRASRLVSVSARRQRVTTTPRERVRWVSHARLKVAVARAAIDVTHHDQILPTCRPSGAGRHTDNRTNTTRHLPSRRIGADRRTISHNGLAYTSYNTHNTTHAATHTQHRLRQRRATRRISRS
jgi:hypothetical protein